MFAKRLRCSKCGKTLLNSCGKSVVWVQCSCGAITYPNVVDDDIETSEQRHKKYEQQKNKNRKRKYK